MASFMLGDEENELYGSIDITNGEVFTITCSSYTIGY